MNAALVLRKEKQKSLFTKLTETFTYNCINSNNNSVGKFVIMQFQD